MSEQNSPAEQPQPTGAAPAGPETVGQAPAEGADQAPATAEEAPKKKGGIARFLISILIIAVAGGAYWFLNRDSIENAKAGDCLGGTTIEALVVDDLKIVTCGEADAVIKVVERVEGKTKIAADIDPGCKDPSVLGAVWFGKEGQTGAVLCLAKAS